MLSFHFRLYNNFKSSLTKTFSCPSYFFTAFLIPASSLHMQPTANRNHTVLSIFKVMDDVYKYLSSSFCNVQCYSFVRNLTLWDRCETSVIKEQSSSDFLTDWATGHVIEDPTSGGMVGQPENWPVRNTSTDIFLWDHKSSKYTLSFL
jgi:hypothetical protein